MLTLDTSIKTQLPKIHSAKNQRREQPKRITIAASSEEDLIKQLTSIDWEKV